MNLEKNPLRNQEDDINNYEAWMIIRTEDDKVLCRSTEALWFEDFIMVDPRKVVLYWTRDKDDLCSWIETAFRICKKTEEDVLNTVKNKKFEFIKIKVINQKLIL